MSPLVSIIILTRNGVKLLRKCVESIRTKTTYSNYDILIVDNGSDEPQTLQYLNDLANGQLCVVLAWSGDVLQARTRAQEAGNGHNIAYVIPKEGTLMWFDTMAIPKDALHVENAYKFLDYILRAEVMAAISNQMRYANANLAATAKLNPTVANDTSIRPGAATRATLFPNVVNPPAYDRLVTRAWTRIKTNQ